MVRSVKSGFCGVTVVITLLLWCVTLVCYIIYSSVLCSRL